MKLSLSSKIIISIILVVFGVVSRWLPHAPNFTPVFAVTLFSAVYLGRTYHIAVPIALMFLSDLFIGFYSFPIMISVYGSFILAGFLGELIKKLKIPITIAASSFLGSFLFFIITNGAVWFFGSMYEHTLSGLVLSYEMGLPFFRNMILGDFFYVAILFGVYESVIFLVKNKVRIAAMLIVKRFEV